MNIRKFPDQIALTVLVVLLQVTLVAAENPFELVRLEPLPYDHALRNPLKGLTTRGTHTDHPWATLAHDYLCWNELENDKSDSLQKILDVCNERWAGLPAKNIKVIPRVYLHWSDDDQKYWPDDMQAGDYTSDQFQARLLRLIKRLGQAWNDDPRVAFVELGIFGKWGEHHSPSPTEPIQKLAADAFARALPNKQISVRHAWSEFVSQEFGEYWDSFAHLDQMYSHGRSIAQLNRESQHYQTNYIGGEVAYDWGNWKVQPGVDPTTSLAIRKHRDFVCNTIRWTHCTQLRWIADYDDRSAAARQGADVVQRALGYRFVPTSTAFSPNIDGGKLCVEVTIRNEGSAPFYYDWPVEFSLLDATDRSVAWRSTAEGIDIRDWLPGDRWTEPEFGIESYRPLKGSVKWPQEGCEWEASPEEYRIAETFRVDVPAGRYFLAIAILDPAGMLPSVRLATSQYFSGGRHPLGVVVKGAETGGALPLTMKFDDPHEDTTTHYQLP
jgi:hypothetical protein